MVKLAEGTDHGVFDKWNGRCFENDKAHVGLHSVLVFHRIFVARGPGPNDIPFLRLFARTASYWFPNCLRFHRRDSSSDNYTGSWTLFLSRIGTWDHCGGNMPLVRGIYSLVNQHLSEGLNNEPVHPHEYFPIAAWAKKNQLLLLPSLEFHFPVPATCKINTGPGDDEIETKETEVHSGQLRIAVLEMKNNKNAIKPIIPNHLFCN